MNAEAREKIVERLIATEREMIDTKGREYTGGAEKGNEQDTLANFKRVAERTGLHPMQVWSVYFLKHIDSISTFIKDTANNDKRELSEPIEGRIVDARTYLGLLMCLIEEQATPPDVTLKSEALQNFVGQRGIAATPMPPDDTVPSITYTGAQQ